MRFAHLLGRACIYGEKSKGKEIRERERERGKEIREGGKGKRMRRCDGSILMGRR